MFRKQVIKQLSARKVLLVLALPTSGQLLWPNSHVLLLFYDRTTNSWYLQLFNMYACLAQMTKNIW